MGKILFATDLHFDHCNEEMIKSFAYDIVGEKPDAIVLSGDLSLAPDFEIHMRYFEMQLKGIPVYFVCGNHDYYKGSIEAQRENLLKPKFSKGGSIWLPTAGVVSLSPSTALVGHDGWYDGGWPGWGNWFDSTLDMSDYYVIHELRGQTRMFTFDNMQYYARQGADHARKYLREAFKDHDHVFFITHVSPFPPTSRAPDGAISDKNWMPSFCSYQMGQALLEVFKEQPEGKELTVLHGHNHTPAFYEPEPGLKVICGSARYGRLTIAGLYDYL